MSRGNSSTATFFVGLLLGLLLMVIVAFFLSNDGTTVRVTSTTAESTPLVPVTGPDNGADDNVRVSWNFQEGWNRFVDGLSAIAQTINEKIIQPIGNLFRGNVVIQEE